MVAILHLTQNLDLLKKEILFRPLISFSIQSLKKLYSPNDIYVLSHDEFFSTTATRYGVTYVKGTLSDIQEIRQADESVVVLNGLNPSFNLEVYKNTLKDDCIEFIDIQQNPIGNYFPSFKELNNVKNKITVDLNGGFCIQSEAHIQMLEGLLKVSLKESEVPLEMSPEYVIHRTEKRAGLPELLFSAPYDFFPQNVKELYESNFNITYAYRAPREVVAELLISAGIWLTGTCPTYPIDKELLDNGKKLKMIATPSTGTNHIDVAYAISAGIKICSIKTSDFLKNIHASSEHSFALLLSMIKKIPMVYEQTRVGIWREKEDFFRSIELNKRVIGLIGYGRIGRNMARYCNSFGMKILAFDPFVEINDEYVEQTSSREELLERSEIVSLHYHLTPENYNSFGSADFQRMKQGAYFLNTARGELVDDESFLMALQEGKLRAAAVDVITNEAKANKWLHPLIQYSRLNDNLFITPHTAGLTVDSESKAAMEIFNEIKKNYDF